MKFILQPLELHLINQGFGENNACYRYIESIVEVITPKVQGQCPVGYRPMYSMMKGHNGLDLRAWHNDILLCPVDGFVEELEGEESRGIGVGIITSTKWPCVETGKDEYFKLRFWHLKSFSVKLNQQVSKGDWIGNCDNTGYSSGDHLHLEVKPVAQDKNGNWYNILQDNGYFGAVDPTPYIRKINIQNTLEYRQETPEIAELQYALKLYKYFPLDQKCTGYYGSITAKSVLKFQKENVFPLSFWEKYILAGKRFGEKSVKVLNERFYG